ncbi:hypothetical protein O6H91_11G098600 [Diphasiastrum complanatum]|uniref:Uncharacterized protein n=1 Tax=Diphasiastrum complanatum TaxID=34168 RepID=A0ACC2CC66_DIPCM|nr:hypothetical protein O6H91_11G098600 [Diphasiastrum complanatum]
MANANESRRSRPALAQQEFDVRHLIEQAQVRWLKPPEICEILQNYERHNFQLNPVAPDKPPSGSIFLFDRKALRYYRKDGHNWRKKNDGKTVREAHERLKVGSIEVLHCYYAHGEDNDNFQRRSYWMLEGVHENIVLVHYLEVKQGAKSKLSQLTQIDIASNVSPSKNQELSYPTTAGLPLPPEIGSSPGTSEVQLGNSSLSSELEGADIEDLPLTDARSTLQQLSRLEIRPGATDVRAPFADSEFARPDWLTSVSSFKHDFAEELKPVVYSRDSQSVAYEALQGLDNMEMPELLQDPGTIDLPSWNEFIDGLQGNDLAGSTEEVKDLIKREADFSIWEDLLEICNHDPSSNYDLPPDALYNVSLGVSQSSVLLQTTVGIPPYATGSGYLMPNGFSQGPQICTGVPFQALEENALEAAAMVNDHKSGTLQLISSSKASSLFEPVQHMTQNQPLASASTYDAENLNDIVILSALQPQLQENSSKIMQPPQEHVLQHEECQKESQQLCSLECDQLTQLISPSITLTQKVNNAEIVSPVSDTSFMQKAGIRTRKKTSGVADRFQVEKLSKLEQHKAPLSMECAGDRFAVNSNVRMDIELEPSLTQEMKFSILDFSPNWGFSYEETKVLISGIFLKTENPLQCQWSCVFGEVEVPAEVANVGVISCKAPSHSPGRVPFFVSSGDKSVRSEVRLFEYRTKMEGCSYCATPSSAQSGRHSPKAEEALLQIRLVCMLFTSSGNACKTDIGRHWEPNRFSSRVYSCSVDEIDDWDSVESLASVSSSIGLKEKIFQMMMKEKLEDWLLTKVSKDAKAALVLNDSGQGLLHLVAALGYDWAVLPILAAGVGVNFRDTRGWTALHWAALYGRENTVLTLLAVGAAAGALTDPTPESVNGCTPADLAASNGHGGLAGYLAEMSLTTHLKSLTIIEKDDKEFFSLSLDWEGENAVEALSDKIRRQQAGDQVDNELSLEQSLRAVRNAAQTAALIRAAFRQHSFRKREVDEIGVLDEYGLSSLHVRKLVAAQKLQRAFQAHLKKRHSAATQIQSKFRSWSRRKDFLDLRYRVIKIQAHVRGYKVRKQYEKVLWAVGVLEKSILRWRRKRTGLREFHLGSHNAMEEDTEAVDDDDDFFKEGRRQKELVVEKAVKRVQSMVGSSGARAQYSRLLEGSQQHKFAIVWQVSNE